MSFGEGMFFLAKEGFCDVAAEILENWLSMRYELNLINNYIDFAGDLYFLKVHIPLIYDRLFVQYEKVICFLNKMMCNNEDCRSCLGYDILARYNGS